MLAYSYGGGGGGSRNWTVYKKVVCTNYSCPSIIIVGCFYYFWVIPYFSNPVINSVYRCCKCSRGVRFCSNLICRVEKGFVNLKKRRYIFQKFIFFTHYTTFSNSSFCTSWNCISNDVPAIQINRIILKKNSKFHTINNNVVNSNAWLFEYNWRNDNWILSK